MVRHWAGLAFQEGTAERNRGHRQTFGGCLQHGARRSVRAHQETVITGHRGREPRGDVRRTREVFEDGSQHGPLFYCFSSKYILQR